MKKLMLVVGWFLAVIPLILFSIVKLGNYRKVKEGNRFLALQAKEMLPKNGYQFYAALPQVLGSFSVAIAKEDARPEILRQFLRLHNSPLENYAQNIVSVSDAKGVDFRLITAIGMCESNLGKVMPEGSFNAWGYAIYTGESSGANFKDWNEAIEIMADYLASKYYSQGLTTPEQIGPIYAPPSVENGNSWAKCVRGFMEKLQ